jgi:hypothetical protein
MKHILLFGMMVGLMFAPMTMISVDGLSVLSADAAGLVPCDGSAENPCNACAFTLMANNLIQFLFTLLTLGAVLMIVYAGFQMVVSQGDPGAWSKAKGMLTSIIIGFIIILSAWLVVDTVIKTLVDSSTGLGMWNQLDGSCR